MRRARYANTKIGRSLTRVSYALDDLESMWGELKDPLHDVAEIHMDDVADHVATIRDRLRAARDALESAGGNSEVSEERSAA